MVQKKSVGMAYLLWLFGAHYAYLGKPIVTVLLWLSMFAGIGLIWLLIDLFRIPSLVDATNKELLEQERLRQRREALDTATLAVLEKIAGKEGGRS
ncbi:MAG: TM2 domain-containing protein [Candidatus Caldarchaeum sp.]